MSRTEGSWGFGIHPNNSQDTGRLVDRGLVILAVCEFGLGRGPDIARYFSKIGTPAIFLDRGLYGLSRIEKWRQESVLQNLRSIPKIVYELLPDELEAYGFLLEALGAKEYKLPR